jgi:hypothetical protein
MIVESMFGRVSVACKLSKQLSVAPDFSFHLDCFELRLTAGLRKPESTKMHYLKCPT